jgi:hypothetical protein
LNRIKLRNISPQRFAPLPQEFSTEERREFIFHVFRRLAIGGGLCQHEDDAGPYLAATR